MCAAPTRLNEPGPLATKHVARSVITETTHITEQFSGITPSPGAFTHHGECTCLNYPDVHS
jgi:hypothetical protein